MNNLYFVREGIGRIPFNKEDIDQLISDDFEIVQAIQNENGDIDTLVVKSTKYPDIIDPLNNGIGIYLQENGGYLIDPRYLSEEDIFWNEILPELMIDLELEYDEEYQ